MRVKDACEECLLVKVRFFLNQITHLSSAEKIELNMLLAFDSIIFVERIDYKRLAIEQLRRQ